MELIQKVMRRFLVATLFVGLGALSANVNASTVGFADIVVEYFDSGAGSLSCAEGQGGIFPPNATKPTCVLLNVVLGGDGNFSDYLSLPKGSFITVGFTDDMIVDGPGDDIFIFEVGDAQEFAEIYVSSSLSTNPDDFVLIGTANGNTVTSFDLATIGFTDPVLAVKIVSLANGGFPAAPGFDLAHVEAINFQDVVDSDTDGVLDSVDNCTLAMNSNQRDTDADGIGNACDPDFNQDCIVNFVDVSIFSANFLASGDLATDINGDGVTNFLDFSVLTSYFLEAPGPAALPNSCVAP